jgi:hypothetical protein
VALTLGAMITKRRWMLTIIAGGALTVFAVSSIVSLVGFGASNRVAASALHKQEGEAILQRHEAAVNARLEHTAWLRRTSVDRELPKAERKQLLAEASDQIKALAINRLIRLIGVSARYQAKLFAPAPCEGARDHFLDRTSLCRWGSRLWLRIVMARLAGWPNPRSWCTSLPGVLRLDCFDSAFIAPKGHRCT